MPASVEFKNLNTVIKRFDNVVSALKNPDLALKDIGARGFKDITEHFNKSEGSTKEWDKLEYRKGKPLMDTGRLRNRMSFKYNRTSVELIKDISYAAYHQYGTKHIPKRDFMWISKKARDAMNKIFMNFIMRSYK